MKELIEINLLPVEQRQIKRNYSFLIDHRVIWPTLCLIACGIIYFVASQFFSNTLDNKNAEITRLENEITQNRSILDQIRQLEATLAERDAKNRSLRSITFNKQLWVRILEGINISLPPNAWLTEIIQRPDSSTTMLIRGNTFVFSEVATLMINLEKNDYFDKVNLDQIEIAPIANQARDAFQFTLNCQLNLSLGAANPLTSPTLP